jgi:hypothetical protein
VLLSILASGNYRWQDRSLSTAVLPAFHRKAVPPARRAEVETAYGRKFKPPASRVVVDFDDSTIIVSA